MKTLMSSKLTLVLIYISIVVPLVILCRVASAATYYVSPSGNDSNSGLMNSPFRSIQKAANVVNPGDTVIVKDGTYTDIDGDDYVVRLNKGGTSSAWLTFKSENKWGAKLNGQYNTSGYCWAFGSNANYVRVEGFELYGCSSKGFHSNAAGHDIYIFGNHIHDIGRWCTDTTSGQDGIYLGTRTSNHTIDSNVIHHVGRLPNCGAYWENHDHGLYVNGSSDDIVKNNIFYKLEAGWAIHLYGGAQDNIKIINNSFGFPNPNKEGHVLITSGSSNIFVQNNIFYNALSAGVNIGSCSGRSNITITNNVSTNGILYGPTDCGWTMTDNQQYTDLKFVDIGTFNFHLKSDSPAINKGLSFSGRTKDADGNSIVGAPDIGAYEYVSGSTDAVPPAPPAVIEVK